MMISLYARVKHESPHASVTCRVNVSENTTTKATSADIKFVDQRFDHQNKNLFIMMKVIPVSEKKKHFD